MLSAVCLMSEALTLQANLFQEFQPMGGVSARPWEMAGAGGGAEGVWATSGAAIRRRAMRKRFFMTRNFIHVGGDGGQSKRLLVEFCASWRPWCQWFLDFRECAKSRHGEKFTWLLRESRTIILRSVLTEPEANT